MSEIFSMLSEHFSGGAVTQDDILNLLAMILFVVLICGIVIGAIVGFSSIRKKNREQQQSGRKSKLEG